MAPSVNLADDLAELSKLTGQLFRLLIAGTAPSTLTAAAPAAGLSTGEALAFVNGLQTLAPRQTVRYCNAVLEARRVTQAAYTLSTRTPAQPREPSEASLEGANEAIDRMTKAHPGWTFSFDGSSTFETGAVKLVWHAHHPDRETVSGANVHELESKVARWEAAGAENKKYGGRLFSNS